MTYQRDSSETKKFIHHEEILDTLEYVQNNKDNRALTERLIEGAVLCRGLTHREATILLECNQPDLIEYIFHLAKEIKQKSYGNRIVMFAPFYLSSYCVSSCLYCLHHAKNKMIVCKKLTQEGIHREVIALRDMGHKRLASEVDEYLSLDPTEYILESTQTVYSIKHKNGAIRRVNVNIAATTTESYRQLKEAGVGVYILFQRTYHKNNYEVLHLIGPKSNYAYYTEAMDRAMGEGTDDVGVGAPSGLNTCRYDFIGLLVHIERPEVKFGIDPHIISIPRICSADGISTGDFLSSISDEILSEIVAVIRIAAPYTGVIVSTHELQKSRKKILELDTLRASDGSCTSVGGYAGTGLPDHNSVQFDVGGTRILDEMVNWLLKLGYILSFCTACYREGRTGDRFMSLVRSGQIASCCGPNALTTLKEYPEDYASEDTRQKRLELILKETDRIPNPKIREIVTRNLKATVVGQRGSRFQIIRQCANILMR